MARVFLSAAVFFCVAAVTLAVINQPCNDAHADCSLGECCANVPGKYDDFKGICQPYLKSSQECDPAGPKDGHCGCGHSLMCVGFAGTPPRCHFILP
ncbi:hypothetical protein BsWGS_20115 [Bradybaena similaris]